MLGIGIADNSSSKRATGRWPMDNVLNALHVRAISRLIERIVADLKRDLIDSYQPEKHYMRGTGHKVRDL